eukprot:2061852-Amphidinium_carterae.1
MLEISERVRVTRMFFAELAACLDKTRNGKDIAHALQLSKHPVLQELLATGAHPCKFLKPVTSIFYRTDLDMQYDSNRDIQAE